MLLACIAKRRGRYVLDYYDNQSKRHRQTLKKGTTKKKVKEKLREIEDQHRLNLIFPNKAGDPIKRNNLVCRYFETTLENAELGKVRFHDLRHTYASLLIQQGENIKYIQSQLGHSSPSVTLNVYAHLMKPVNQEAASKLENKILSLN